MSKHADKQVASSFWIVASILLFIIFAAGSNAAFGAEATSTLSWSAPTERVDGTPMGIDEIAEYRVYYTIDGPVDAAGEYILIKAFQTREAVTLDLAPRSEPYLVNFAISTVDTNGLESALSPTVSKTFDVNSTAAPMPPTGLDMTIQCGDGCTITVVE